MPQRHVVDIAVLGTAFIARHVIAGAVEGARQGYRATRSELGDSVPPHAIDAALRAWSAEGERLAATACAVGPGGACPAG